MNKQWMKTVKIAYGEAAKRQVIVVIKYKKFVQLKTMKKAITVCRRIEMYEIRDDSIFGYDVKKDDHIRRYNIGKILRMKLTDIQFKPRWEIKPC